MKQSRINNFIKCINAIEIIGVCFIIIVAFWFQFILKELPCPLCLLQRLGLLAIAFGFLLNIRYRVRPIHYGLSLISAILTAFIALRQIALHINTTTGYGSSFFGIHMYTWVFIICCIAIIYIAIMLSFPKQYELKQNKREIAEAKGKKIKIFSHIAFAIYLIIIASNALSTFSECGLTQCPDNPTSYQIFHP